MKGGIYPLLVTILFLNFRGSHGGSKFSPVKTVEEIDSLATAEILFAQNLKNTLESLEEPHLAIKYIKAFEAGTVNLKDYNQAEELKDKATALVSNPLGIYHMVHRFLNELSELKEKLNDSHSTQRLLDPFPSNLWFTVRDLNDTMENFVELCHVYNLNVTDFVDGIVRGLDFGGKLSGKDCYDVGVLANKTRKLGLSVMFFEEASRKVAEDHTMDSEEVEAALNQTIKLHDKEAGNKTVEVLNKQFLFNRKLGPLRKRHGELYKVIRIYQRTLLARVPVEEIQYTKQTRRERDYPPYYDLCEHQNLLHDDEKRDLFCWYETTLDPYWKINPLKMEIHSKVPELIQIYDIIGPKKREFLKRTAVAVGFLNPVDKLRNIETVLIREQDHPEIKTIVLDMEKITGLNLSGPNSAQRIRVAANTPGSTFHTHLDKVPEAKEDLYRDTSSTFLYYLGEPGLGGATGFVKARVAITPVEGSAIYWIDTLDNGEPDDNLLHGGCPVLFGRKWVATKFINYADQFLNMKCGMNVNEQQLPMFPKSKLLQQRFYSKKRNFKNYK